jgi:hypothetical protein
MKTWIKCGFPHTVLSNEVLHPSRVETLGVQGNCCLPARVKTRRPGDQIRFLKEDPDQFPNRRVGRIKIDELRPEVNTSGLYR